VRAEAVDAGAGGEGTILHIAGFALQRKEQFEEEFARVVADLERATGGGAPRVPDPVGAGASAGGSSGEEVRSP
jgi:hypothetical protein